MYVGEKFNSISHIAGAVLAFIGLGALLNASWQTADPSLIIGYSIFGVSLALLYTMSALYHSLPPSPLKKRFKLFDHICIYILIAGTYTPFLLSTLESPNSRLMLFMVWSLAVLGIASEIFLSGKIVKSMQIFLYLAMGWTCSIDLDIFKQALSDSGFQWLVTGGLAYTGGIIFYLLDKLKLLTHAHGIWHLFVMVGSVAHFIAVIGYVN